MHRRAQSYCVVLGLYRWMKRDQQVVICRPLAPNLNRNPDSRQPDVRNPRINNTRADGTGRVEDVISVRQPPASHPSNSTPKPLSLNLYSFWLFVCACEPFRPRISPIQCLAPCLSLQLEDCK